MLLEVASDCPNVTPPTVTPPEYGDVVWLDELPIEPGSYYIMDRGYAACGMPAIKCVMIITVCF
jgi:hypothetical protein